MSDELHARDATITKIARDLALARKATKVTLALCAAMFLTVVVLVVIVARVGDNTHDIRNLEALCRTRPLFDFMINAPSEGPRTPAQQELVKQFRVIIDTAYADCPASATTTESVHT